MMWIPIKAVQSIKLVIQSCRELKTNSAVSESIHEFSFKKKIPKNQPMDKAENSSIKFYILMSNLKVSDMYGSIAEYILILIVKL